MNMHIDSRTFSSFHSSNSWCIDWFARPPELCTPAYYLHSRALTWSRWWTLRHQARHTSLIIWQQTVHSKQGFTLAANISHCCSLSNYPMQCCCEILLKFVATRIISNFPIFHPHCSPLVHAHTRHSHLRLSLLSVLFWRLLLFVSTSLHKQIGSRETL